VSRTLKKPWLDSFTEYCEGMETPKEYIQWAGLSVLSASLKRRCYIWYRGIKFYPNQYIILVGPPGIGKGEAINAATKIANEIKAINYIKDWVTPQEIIEELSAGFSHVNLKPGQIITTNIVQDHTCCIMAPELAVFIQQYDNLHSLMCAWWDQNKFDYKTKNKGKHVIEDMSVSLLGGCVPDYVRSLSKDRLAPITGGFTARTIFVYATEKFQLIDNSFGAPNGFKAKIHDELVNDLKHITTLSGELHVEKNAISLWQQTYQDHNKRGSIDSDASANFKSRISSHIIKAAISYSISETDNLIITRDHLERAIRAVEQIRDKVDIVFRSIGESPLAVTMDKVIKLVDMKGMCGYKELLKHVMRDATQDQLGGILAILVRTGVVTEKVNTLGQVEYWSTRITQNPTTQGVGNP
jgi:hypothetical protein